MNKSALLNNAAVWLTAAVLASAGAGIASAADMPVKAPVVSSNWSGFYLGIHGGYGYGRFDDVFAPNSGNAGFFVPSVAGETPLQSTLRGGVAGGHVGFNQQAGHSLFGLEASFDWTGVSRSLTNPFPVAPGGAGTATYDFRLNWLAAITPRIGVIHDNWLFYAKAGLAVAQFRARYANAAAPAGTTEFSETANHAGMTLGAGLEYAFTPHWILGLEYNYYLFNSQLYGAAMVQNGGGNAYLHSTISMSFSTALARLTYRFDDPGHRDQHALVTKAPRHAHHAGWTGAYFGLHAGWGWADAAYTFRPDYAPFAPTATGGSIGHRMAGALAGGQLGYNQQIGNVVVGLEAAASATWLRGATDVFPIPGLTGNENIYTRLNWLASVTPRLGWASDHWLVYAKGGAAAGGLYSQLNRSFVVQGIPIADNFNESANHVGWIAGGGVEYRTTSNWSVGIDYSHYDLGKASYGGNSNPAGGAAAYSIRLTVDAVVARLNYRFD
jgi:outer membrane immunogenic protein